MFIIDKNKDYYDYFSKVYGSDKNITFDRRGSKIITDENVVNIYNYDKHEGQFFILEVGNVQYLIRLYDLVLKKADYLYSTAEIFVSVKMEIKNIFRNNKNNFGFPISIRSVDIPNRSYHYDKKTGKFKTDYTEYCVTNTTVINLPILANTQLTRLINPEEIWKELSNYISSLKNDKDSVFVPDIQKVVNHGFDKKESFRNIK